MQKRGVNLIEVHEGEELTPERLEAMIQDIVSEDEKHAELERYKHDVQLADAFAKDDGIPGTVDLDELLEYENMTREVLKELKKLLSFPIGGRYSRTSRT